MSPEDEWPYTCNQCGHIHANSRLASICIGCPCPATTVSEYIAPKGESSKGAIDV